MGYLLGPKINEIKLRWGTFHPVDSKKKKICSDKVSICYVFIVIFSLQKDANDRSSAQALLLAKKQLHIFMSFQEWSARLNHLSYPSLAVVIDAECHSFLSMYDDLHVDLASYFTTAGSPLATFK